MDQKYSPLTEIKDRFRLPTFLRRLRWRRFEWLFIACLWLLGLLLGYLGFARHAAMHGQARSGFDLLYLTLQLVTMNSGAVEPPVPAALQIARFLLPFVSAYAVFQGLMGLFRKQWERVTCRGTWEHVVICGLSRKGYLLAQGFRQLGKRVVVIERDETNDWLEACRELGVTVLDGDAGDPNTLRLAGVGRAAALIAVLEDDGANAAIAMQARRMKAEEPGARRWFIQRSPPALTCTVHLSDPRLVDLLRGHEFSSDFSPAFRLGFFNVFARSARTMLQEHSAMFRAAPPAELHLLVVGLGRLGETLTAYAAGEWHALWNGAGGLHITVLDRNAGPRVRALCLRYPQMAKICRLYPVDLDVRSPDFAEAAFLQVPGQRPVDEAYICLDSDSLGISTALRLRRLLGQGIPIAVRVAQAGGLEALLEGRQADHIHTFPLLERACTVDLLATDVHETIARALHADYVRRGEERVETPESNPSLVPWEVLPKRLRESNHRQAREAIKNLAALGYGVRALSDWSAAAAFGFSAAEVEKMAQMEHASWMREMSKDGYRYAPGEKDARAKTHPDLRPWDELTEEAREKDRHPYLALPRILPRVGLQIYRE